jgi:hypothetical protein
MKATVDGGPSTTVAIGATGDWQAWQSQQGNTTLALTAGAHVLKLDMLTSGYNINWVELQKVGELPGTVATLGGGDVAPGSSNPALATQPVEAAAYIDPADPSLTHAEGASVVDWLIA